MVKLRDYQIELHDAVIDFLENEKGNGVVCSPGGTGKTLTMNALIKTLVMSYPGIKIMSVCNDATVIDQNVDSMIRYWPTCPIGVYSAGLKQRDVRQRVIFAGIQSIAKRAEEFGSVHVVLVDECDLLSPKEDALYQKFLSKLKEKIPGLRVIGFTATPFRLGIGLITEMDIWSKIIIDFTRGDKFLWFVENGFLSPLINKKAAKEIDITNLSMRCGDFDEKEMQAAADTEELNRSVVDEMIRYGSDRNHWLLFSAGIRHGHNLTKLLNSKGIPTIMLTGADSREVRDKGESDFRKGIYRCLVNVGLYGRGYDFPELDLIGVARATQSTSFWLQVIKRGTRIAENKDNCLILDFAGNTRRLGPVNLPNIPAPRKKGQAEKGEMPLKVCPNCFSYVAIQAKVCPDCGEPFPPPSTIQKTASNDAIMATEKKSVCVEEFQVYGIRYKLGSGKKGSYLKVTYPAGTTSFHEYKNFESESNYHKKTLKMWWTHRRGSLPLPENNEEALERAGKELLIPTIIRVDVNSKYNEIVGVEVEEINE